MTDGRDPLVVNRHGEPARLREFVNVQAASLLAGDPAWTSALLPAIHFR